MRGLLHQVISIIIITIVFSFITTQFMEMRIFSLAFPEQAALFDFQFEDFIFSVKESKPQGDTNIVLINIGLLSRAQIAEQINIISRYKPKVIGMDVIFGCPLNDCTKVEEDDKSLSEAIRSAGNVVLGSIPRASRMNSSDQYDSLEVSDPLFSDYARNGSVMFAKYHDPRIRAARSFYPKISVNDVQTNSFAVEIAYMADSSITKKFLSRNRDIEIINYKGDIYYRGLSEENAAPYFSAIDYEEVQSGQLDSTLLTNKIIIMGFLGEITGHRSYADMLYSPFNRTVFGKTLPDMYGSVIHANIISMILNEDYIDVISEINAWIVSLIIIALNVVLFIWLHHRNTVWYEPLTLIVPGTQIIFIAYIRYLLFIHFNYILDLSHATVMLVSVSLASGIYFGPFQFALLKFKKLSFKR